MKTVQPGLPVFGNAFVPLHRTVGNLIYGGGCSTYLHPDLYIYLFIYLCVYLHIHSGLFTGVYLEVFSQYV